MPREPWLIASRLICCASLLLAATSCEDEDTDVADVPEYESVERGETYAHQETESTTTTADLAITPTTADLAKDGDMVTFSVSGGTSPYTWSVSDVFRGSVVDSGGKSAAYQRTAAGDNSVICTDSNGSKVYAVINQP